MGGGGGGGSISMHYTESQAHPPVSMAGDSCKLTYHEDPVYSSHGREGRSGIERDDEERVGEPREGVPQELQENGREGGGEEGSSPREQEDGNGCEHSTNCGLVCEEGERGRGTSDEVGVRVCEGCEGVNAYREILHLATLIGSSGVAPRCSKVHAN